MTGTVVDANGSAPIQITLETGGKARIDRSGSNSVSRFDGGPTGTSSISPGDAKLIESLVDDLPETLMAHVAAGNPIRSLGVGFVDLEGNHCDYVQVPVQSKTKTQSPRYRRYCFDSQTGLMHYVQYLEPSGGNSIAVQVDFLDWRSVDGQAVPGSIVRRENGVRVFALTFQTLAVADAAEDGLFKQETTDKQ